MKKLGTGGLRYIVCPAYMYVGCIQTGTESILDGDSGDVSLYCLLKYERIGLIAFMCVQY